MFDFLKTIISDNLYYFGSLRILLDMYVSISYKSNRRPATDRTINGEILNTSTTIILL